MKILSEREGVSQRPPAKARCPLAQFLWELCLKVLKPGGYLLSFAGSGSTLVAAVREQFKYVGIELNEEYIEIAKKRLADEET